MNKDLISRSELIEFARNHIGGMIDINDIARFPAAQSGWIDAKKELPKAHLPVIVCREKEKGRWTVEQGHMELNGWWRVYGSRVKKIAYWRPLPIPPEDKLT